MSSSKWQKKNSYPYKIDISYFSILTVEKKFIMFGGMSSTLDKTTGKYKETFESTITRFDPIQDSWKKLGNLKVARQGHSVIQVDNEFIVVGGKGNFPTESCKLDGQSMTCTTREPKLDNFSHYPVLMVIP